MTSVPVAVLYVDDRPVAPASPYAATLTRSRSEWAIVIQADWSSDLCDRIRRSGVIANADIRLRTSDGGFAGAGRMELAGEVEEGIVEVLVTGVTPLTPMGGPTNDDPLEGRVAP